MTTLQEIRCSQAAKTILGHIRELADTQNRCSTGLSITIYRLDAELDLLKVIRETWTQAESAAEKETTNQNQNA